MINKEQRQFNLYSWSIIALFTIILILRWRWMPTFIDIYYHLLTTLNFQKCGGIPTISFWEYAPYGRPHLYPPLLHILMLIVYKVKGNIITVSRIFELLSFPLVLSTIFIVIKKVFNTRLAFWAVLVSSSMYSFYLSCVDFLPASLALCLGLLIFYSIERKRIIAATVFMTLSFYSHISISFFFLLALIVYAIFSREKLRPILKVAALSLLFYLPLLIHQLRYFSFFDPQRVEENFPFEINILVYCLAIIGLFLAARKKRQSRFFIALIYASLAFLPLRYRILSGQGMLGIIFLASLTLDSFYAKLRAQVFNRQDFLKFSIYLLFIFFAIFLISPTITIQQGKAKFNLIGSTYFNIFPTQEIRERSNELSIYLPKTFAPLFDAVKEKTEPDDLITSNHEYLAGFVSVFTDRPTSSAMLPEIRPFREINPIRSAKLIIWLKDPDRTTWQPINLIERLGLIKVAETDVFFVYKNPKARFKRVSSQAVLPFELCLGILFILLTILTFDLARKR